MPIDPPNSGPRVRDIITSLTSRTKIMFQVESLTLANSKWQSGILKYRRYYTVARTYEVYLRLSEREGVHEKINFIIIFKPKCNFPFVTYIDMSVSKIKKKNR